MINEHAAHVPAPALRGLVGSYIGFRQAGAEPARHRGLPSGSLTLIFTLDDPLVLAAHPDPRQPAGIYETIAGGLHTSPAIITHDGRQSGIQLGLSPLGARILLGRPVSSLKSMSPPPTYSARWPVRSTTGSGQQRAGRSGSPSWMRR